MQQLKRPTTTFSSKAPSVTERQKVVSTEASRYDYLKKAAEQLMKSQVSSKAELSSMEVKLQKQESVITMQAVAVERLREEKTKLQSILQGEKQQYERLKFDMLALTTITTSLKKEMSSFSESVAQAGRDKDELIKENEALRATLKRTEAELQSSKADCASSKEQLSQCQSQLVNASSLISKLESERNDAKGQYELAQVTIESLRSDLLKGREELKRTANELCSVRGQLSSLDERCTVLQIIERDLTNSIRDKDGALTQATLELKALERDKSSRIVDLESQLAGISTGFEQLKTDYKLLQREKASAEEVNTRILAERAALSVSVEELRDNNKVLQAQLSELEHNCQLAQEEKRACNEEQVHQISLLETSHEQAVEALKLELEERLRESRSNNEEKIREIAELQLTLETQRRDFSVALANEIQKQKELYQSQIDQLHEQLQDSARVVKQLKESHNAAVKEANPLELLDEDESDEVLSGTRDEKMRKEVLPIQPSRARESLPLKKVSPPANNKSKKLVNKSQLSESSGKRFTPNAVSHKKIAPQVNQRPNNKTKKKSKKTLDLFDDVFAFHG